MAQLITRCPACETSFRITEAQLKTAKGAVRCGSCLKIFKAMDYLVGGTKNQSPAAKRPASTQPTPPPKPAPAPKLKAKPRELAPAKFPPADGKVKPGAGAKPRSKLPTGDDFYGEVDTFNRPQRSLSDDEGQANMLRFDQDAIDSDDTDLAFDEGNDFLVSDNLLIDDNSGKSGKKGPYGDDLAESFIDLDGWQSKEKSLFDRKTKPLKDDNKEENKADPDESWAIELLEDTDNEDIELDLKPRRRPAVKPSPELDREEPKARAKAPRAHSHTIAASSARDDSDVEDILGEPVSDQIEPRFDESEAVDLDAEYEYEENYADEDETFYADPADRGALLSRIEPEPVEFSFYRRHFNWRSKLVWGGASALGVIALVVQVAWLQYDTFSRTEPYRGWYQLVGVKIPPVAAPNLIRTSNLVVRSHPEADNALMVDTILLNTAVFSQPYPDLILAFSNIQGKTLAARRFTPAEYLVGELAGSREMPSNQPVHLSLEIVDPGPEAVNYTAYIPRN